MSVWIYTDADNTLWDTDALFADAQLALLAAAEEASGISGPTSERLVFVRRFDQAIAASHHARLRYPPALLVRALAKGLGGVEPEKAAQQVLAEGSNPTKVEEAALTRYSATLSGLPVVLSGVREGLLYAQEHGSPVYVITEGPLEVVQQRLRALSLERFVSGALSAAKSPELYARLKQRAAPRRVVMIGDQPDRDIRFAHEAGLKTILVRSRFQPRWIGVSDAAQADAVTANFLEAARLAAEWGQTHALNP